jgi:hypothetical protein
VKATPFAVRLAAMMVTVVLAASVMTVTLDYLKFRRVLRAQEDAVYAFVTDDLESSIEDGLNLGLPLASLQSTDLLLQRHRVAERGTLGITVFDSTGRVLFDTDRFRVGLALPEAWGPPNPGAKAWRGDVEGGAMTASAIINTFGQQAGGIVLRYDLALIETRMNAILLDMIRAALLMLAVAAAVTVGGAMLLTRRHNAWFRRAAAQMDVGAAGDASGPVQGSEALMASIRQTGAALDDTEAALIAIGTSEAAHAAGAVHEHAI